MSNSMQAPARSPDARQSPRDPAATRVTELKVSGHLMTLDPGLFCIVQTANAPGSASGLPGVRLSLPPGALGRAEGVRISTFREDGWLGERDGAALVRVVDGPAQVLVTIYQALDATPDQAPRLQVLRLSGDAAVAEGAGNRPTPANADVVAHVQRMGDVGAKFGEWMGTRGSRLWIEGFGLAPREDIAPSDIEYQAVLGRDWLSPWVEGGKFCGSRGMALPLLGLTVRLKGEAAETHDLSYEATFVDGSASGPMQAGEPCQAESLAALEAFRIDLRPKEAAAQARTPASRRSGEAARPERAAAPAALPAGRKGAKRG